MGRTYDALDDGLIDWIGRQRLFFVATAPTDSDGLVNVSPKGGSGTLRVLGPTSVAYLDLVGSGVETIAHLRENGRIVLMFCAFAGPPKIVRLHGRGRVVTPESAEWAAFLHRFEPSEEVLHALRSIVVVEVARIGDSCGFVVPRLDFVEDRSQLFKWARHKEEEHGAKWKATYLQTNNRASLDGLPGLTEATDADEADARRFSSVGRAL